MTKVLVGWSSVQFNFQSGGSIGIDTRHQRKSTHQQYSKSDSAISAVICFFRRLPPTASFPRSPMLNLATVAPWLQNQGVYGPVTATLDWCEVKIRTFILSNNQIIETRIGQLPVFALYR